MAIKNKDLLRGLSKEKLKSYIFFLTQKYYVGYLQDDVDEYERAIEQLFFIVEEYGDKYENLDGFICFCLYLNANAEFSQRREHEAFKLDPLFKMDLLENDVEELPFDIKNIFNKERIKERYNAKRTHDDVEKA